MTGHDTDHGTGGDRSRSVGVSRRRFLETVAGAAVASTGVGATAGPVVADTDEILEVDLRDGVPPVSDAPQGEDVVIFNVHGYTGSSASVSQTETLQSTLREVGNTETVTAVTWDDSGFPSTAEASARDQGGVFADWMAQYLEANPGTTVRILGHSMGGIVTYEFLSSANGRFKVANADSIGSYEVSDAPCEGTEFHDAIDSAAKFVGNYFSTNDSIARLGSGPADCGFGGGSLPDNYADVDVSASVGGHTSYKESTGFGQAYISNFQPGVDRGGDGGGDDGGDDGGGDDGGTGDTAPAIDALDASDESIFTDDVIVDWAVSDADGDLATVESGLYSSSGTLLDSAITDLSGSSGSGSHELDPPWYADPATVALRVTDAAGNSTTDQVPAP